MFPNVDISNKSELTTWWVWPVFFFLLPVWAVWKHNWLQASKSPRCQKTLEGLCGAPHLLQVRDGYIANLAYIFRLKDTSNLLVTASMCIAQNTTSETDCSSGWPDSVLSCFVAAQSKTWSFWIFLVVTLKAILRLISWVGVVISFFHVAQISVFIPRVINVSVCCSWQACLPRGTPEEVPESRLQVPLQRQNTGSDPQGQLSDH